MQTSEVADTKQDLTQTAITLHQKYIEILGSIIYEQNRQLLLEIADTYNLNASEVHNEFLVSKQVFYDMLIGS